MKPSLVRKLVIESDQEAQQPDQGAQQPEATPDDSNFGLRWAFIGLVVCVIMIIISSLLQPREYHLAKSIPIYDATLVACDDGFLLRPQKQAYSYYDWQGKERWRIIIPSPASPADRHSAAEHAVGISPNGRVMSAAVAEKGSMWLHTWIKGKPAYALQLTEFPRCHPYLRVMDSGRVFLIAGDMQESSSRRQTRGTLSIAVIDNGREMARAKLPKREAAIVASNGDAIISAGYSSIAFSDWSWLKVTKKTITFFNTYTVWGDNILQDNPNMARENVLTGQFINACLFEGSQFITPYGQRYGPGNLHQQSEGWRYSTVAPGGRYISRVRGTEAQVYSPLADSDTWTLSAPCGINESTAANNGRFCLAFYHAWNGPCLALYENPGRLRAQMVLPFDPYSSRWFPSTDGHSIIMQTCTDRVKLECRIYRW